MKRFIIISFLSACCSHIMAQQADYGREYISMTADTTQVLKSKRPAESERLFRSKAIENKIKEVKRLLNR